MAPLDPPRTRPGPRRPAEEWTDLEELPPDLDHDIDLDDERDEPEPRVLERPRTETSAATPREPSAVAVEPVARRRPEPPGPPVATVPAPRGRVGRQPAGAVLVTMLLGLVLAALINADALVARAERKPLGRDRDRSLMIWHPVQDISHVLQLYRIRDLGDSLAGNRDRGSEDAFAEPRNTTGTTEPEDPTPVLRTPTAAAPLRVYLGGDSIIHDGGLAFIEQTAPDPLLRPHLHYENATGLTRPDFFDWPAALANDAKTYRPEVIALMFGGNDAQGIKTPDGQIFQNVTDAGWQAEYGRRVGFVMDELRAEDRLVLWIGLPPMRSATFEPKARILSRIYEEQAATRPWVRYVDTTKEFGDANGHYVQTKPGPDGAPVDLRKSDGVHFNFNGADRFARYLRGVINTALADYAEPAPPTTTTTTADG